MRFQRALLAAVALAIAWPAPLRAQPVEGGPNEEQRDRARKLMDAGRAKEQAGDYAGALDEYLAADRIMGVPTTGLSVAQAALALGKLVEARDVLRRVERHPRSANEPLPFASARQEAKRLADELDRRIPTLRLVVSGAAPGVAVTITVDGVAVPPDAQRFPRAVNPGRRQLQASAPDHRGARALVDVREGEERTVSLVLGPNIEPAETSDALGGISPLVWVGLGVTVVGLGVGITTGALALSRSDDLEEACDQHACPPSRQSDIDSMTALAHASTVSFVAAGAGAVLAGVALVVLSDWEPGASAEPDASEPPAEALGAEPAASLFVGPGTLMVSGRF